MALPSLGSSHIIIPNDHSHPQGSLSGLTTPVSARVSSLHWHKLPFPRAHHITSSNSDLRAGKAFGKSCWLGETGSKSLPKPKLDLLPMPLQSLCTNGLRGNGWEGLHRHSQVFGRKDPGSSRGSNIFGHGSHKSSLAFWVLHLHVDINMQDQDRPLCCQSRVQFALLLTTKQASTGKTEPISSEGHRERS